MIGGAKGRWNARKLEKLVLANGPTPKIVPQSDEPPQIHLSHTVVSTEALEKEFLRCSGTRYRCFSFVYIDPKAIYWSPRALESYKTNVVSNSHIMLDSGAFSFQMFLIRKKMDLAKMEKLRKETIDLYVEFCKKRQKELDWLVTFDYDQKFDVVWGMTKELEKRGLKPAPVFHGDCGMEYLKRYLDAGYKRIGISSLTRRRSDYGATRRYFDDVFRTAEPYKVKLHGFAVTSLSLTYAYDWFSVDSSSWSRSASYGAIYSLDPERGSLANIHVSLTGGLQSSTRSVTALSPAGIKSVKAQVEKQGWDFDLLRRSLQYRFVYNGWIFSHLNQFAGQVKSTHTQWEKVL